MDHINHYHCYIPDKFCFYIESWLESGGANIKSFLSIDTVMHDPNAINEVEARHERMIESNIKEDRERQMREWCDNG